MSGPEAITYLEILAWSALKDVHPEPEEIQLLRTLDDVYLDEYYTRVNAESTAKSQKGKG